MKYINVWVKILSSINCYKFLDADSKFLDGDTKFLEAVKIHLFVCKNF